MPQRKKVTQVSLLVQKINSMQNAYKSLMKSIKEHTHPYKPNA